MGKPTASVRPEAAGFTCYRITSSGRAAIGDGSQLRSRYLTDLLDLLCMCGGGAAERELHQFMPPASLGESIGTLLELGLIEHDRR